MITNNEWIDQISFRIRNVAGRNFSVPEVHQGLFGVANLSTSYRFYCNNNYYGQNCEIFCQTIYNDTGLYKCDKQGNLQLMEGNTSNYR